VPLFVSVRRLMKRNRLPRAKGPWALDSAGFSELSRHGEWTIPIKTYVAEVRRYVECIGNLQWAACQDWMCEPQILAKTKLTVEEHQRRTLNSYRELMQLAPELPWAPVLQGWTVGDYWRHAEAYQKAGIDLKKAPVVGVGSICRRQATTRATALLATLATVDSLKLHGFGFKIRGLPLAQEFLRSADSLAWSYNARRKPALRECEGLHPSCQNCLTFALKWRRKVLDLLGQKDAPRGREPRQGLLF
jgi:hypothetical protein